MSPVIDVSVKKNSLLVCVRKFLGILVGQCGSVEVRERDHAGSGWSCHLLSF